MAASIERTYRSRIAATVVFAGLAILLGWLAFSYFKVFVAPNPLVLPLVGIALLIGAASFFNPCAFPFLPIYFRHLHATRRGGGISTALFYGAVAAVGLTTFNLILGGVVGGLGQAATSVGMSIMPSVGFRVFRAIVGALFVGFGILQVAGVSLNIPGLGALGSHSSLQGDRPMRGLFVYGFGYSAVGVGCGFPLLAILVTSAVALGGLSGAILAFILYVIVMAFLMVVVSLIPETMRQVRGASVMKIGGGILAAVGAFLIAMSAIPALDQFLHDAFVPLLQPGRG